MSQHHQQLSLPLAHQEQAAQCIIGDANRDAYAMLCERPWTDYAIILSGPARSGKTLLATHWAHAHHAAMLDHAMLHHFPRDATYYTLDDYYRADHTALYALLTHCRDTRTHCLLVASGNAVPQSITLADVRSRLRALPVAMLREPDDIMLIQLLMEYAARRQLSLSPDDAAYIIARSTRSYEVINMIAGLLCDAAHAQRRRLTRPFIRQVLSDDI